MYEHETVAVVIPVYNESGFIGEVIETVPSFVDRVYVVDDRSTDGSWAEVLERADRTIGDVSAERSSVAPTAAVGPLADGGVDSPDRVVAIRHETNRGRGGAVKTGYGLALSDGIDVVAVMDGDGQMDPDVLTRIVDPVAEGRADYAKGNRLVDREHWTSMSGWRLFGNLSLTVLTRIASGYWGMRDPQNGYTAISAEALERLNTADLYEDYGFLNDLLVRLNVHGMRVVDVPMRAVYGEESSGIAYSSFVPNLSALLARRFLWRLWRKCARGRPAGSRAGSGVAVLGSDAGIEHLLALAGSGAGGLPDVSATAIAAIVCLLVVLVVSPSMTVRGGRASVPGTGGDTGSTGRSDPDSGTRGRNGTGRERSNGDGGRP